VEKAFSSKAKEFGDQIVTDIKDMFTEKLKTVDWMDKGTTKLAIEKVHKIVQKSEYQMSWVLAFRVLGFTENTNGDTQSDTPPHPLILWTPKHYVLSTVLWVVIISIGKYPIITGTNEDLGDN